MKHYVNCRDSDFTSSLAANCPKGTNGDLRLLGGTTVGQANSTCGIINDSLTMDFAPDASGDRGLVNLRGTILICVLWLSWGIVYAVNLSIVKDGLSIRETLWLAIPDAIIWAALTAPVLWIGKAVQSYVKGLIWKVLLHLAIGIAVVAFHDLLDALTGYLLNKFFVGTYSGMSVAEYFRNIVPYKWYSHLFLYAAIVGLSQLHEHRRQLSKSQTQMAMLRAHLAESQLQALRLQLQPHFLFNCLNTISGLVDNRPAEARQMINNLAKLLRKALDTEESEIPLHQELDFVRTYLQIEQVRFRNRLEVIESVPNECLSAMVPSFILQPLVENSVRHGLNGQTARNVIEIAATMNRGDMMIEIRDSGVGMDDDSHREGTGLSSVRSRLRQHYGKEQALQIASSTQGTNIRIVIPKRLHESTGG